jgi:hypothetical protein
MEYGPINDKEFSETFYINIIKPNVIYNIMMI